MIILPNIEIGRKKISKDCDVKRHRLMCMAFTKNGHLICVETNRIASHGNISGFSIHAEEAVVNKLLRLRARERFGKIFVLVARLNKANGGWTLAKPCEGCEKKLRDYGITEIYYTDEAGRILSL